MNSYEVSISSPPHREKLVADIFFGKEQWAEINQDDGILQVEFYPRADGEFWTIPFDLAIEALNHARQRLIGR